jgi:two-component system sensor histidine kinase TctE
MAPVDLAELALQTTLDQVATARKKAIDLGFEGPPGSARVAGNALLLRELIVNLLDNAIAHGRPGGSVTVRVHAEAEVVLEVQDDGPGIAPAERERVFERFYRSPSTPLGATPGSGLGLSIVRDIARAHGATVALLSAPGGSGLCVRLVMPASSGAAAAPSPAI